MSTATENAVRYARKWLGNRGWVPLEDLAALVSHPDPKVAQLAAQALVSAADVVTAHDAHIAAVVTMQTAWLSDDPKQWLLDALTDEGVVPPQGANPELWWARRHPEALGLCSVCSAPAAVGDRAVKACSVEHLAVLDH